MPKVKRRRKKGIVMRIDPSLAKDIKEIQKEARTRFKVKLTTREASEILKKTMKKK